MNNLRFSEKKNILLLKNKNRTKSALKSFSTKKVYSCVKPNIRQYTGSSRCTLMVRGRCRRTGTFCL